jgi:hypothetical protein
MTDESRKLERAALELDARREANAEQRKNDEPVAYRTEADIREAMGYSHIADKAVEYLDLHKEVAERRAIRAKAQAEHLKASGEAMTAALSPLAVEFAAKHGLPVPTLSFDTGPTTEPGSYSNTFSGSGMTAEAFASAARDMREQMDGKPLNLQPTQGEPMPPVLHKMLFDPPNPIDPAAIRQRVERATAAPWVSRGLHGSLILPGAMGENAMGFEATHADFTFIGHAREDVPGLLDVIDVLARLLLNPEWQLEYQERIFFCYRPEEIVEALSALGLDTQEKRDAARAKLSWQGGGTLGSAKEKA